MPDDAASGAMSEAGVPPFIVSNLIRLFSLLRHGAQGATTDDIRTLIGRRPSSFAEFAKDHAFVSPADEQALGGDERVPDVPVVLGRLRS